MATAKDYNARAPFPFGKGLSNYEFKAYYVAKAMIEAEESGSRAWCDWSPRFVSKRHMQALKECREAVVEASRKVGSILIWSTIPAVVDTYFDAAPGDCELFFENEQLQFAMIACSLLGIKTQDVEYFARLEIFEE